MFGAVGALISESKNDGQISMKVGDQNMTSIIQEYQRQTGLAKIKTNKSLVSIGK